ncbi:MAG TPA: GNAT family N-acetyltransferase [Tepidisphaeraceae bacterium]
MIIRLSDASDRDVILRFIAEMGFNPRDAATWDSLNMVAMTAWEGSKLIGAIPLEPRILQIGGGSSVKTVHETVVAMHPEWRGRRVGSQLQDAILKERPNDAELATVFREKPESAAYQWYRRNNFSVVVHVESWFADPTAAIGRGDRFELIAASNIGKYWDAIEALRGEAMGAVPGLIGRRWRPLHEWLESHPYHARYAFYIVMRWNGGVLAEYALLGVGKMHSETLRADVLEFCPVNDQPERGRALIDCVLEAALENNWSPVRWPLATSDPMTQVAADLGFKAQWGFDIMARALTPAAGHLLDTAVKATVWRYAGIDYA